ncbi:LAMI_0F08174g1_1 [Lachancea mirantina]|uniref:LAMI_0F08174g1_1 n=1 Tax=Lachancea mirantina TaxID=1230905 RepID=A0A1G4K067_9SACH|nr:LAMI_0F08174g1_1 [Lachancea mirantina]
MGLCASKENVRVEQKPAQLDQRRGIKPDAKRKATQVPKVPNVKKPSAAHVKTKGRSLGEGPNTGNTVSAREAAGKAAAQRFQEKHQTNTKGELGKRLAEERGKSHMTHLKESARDKQNERDEELVFD